MTNEKDASQLVHDEFLARAHFYATYAATLTESGVKTAMLDMAARWRQLAAEAKAGEQAMRHVLDNNSVCLESDRERARRPCRKRRGPWQSKS